MSESSHLSFRETYDDFNSSTDSEQEDDTPIGETLFGSDAYNVGGDNIHIVRKQLASGVRPSQAAVSFACYMGATDVLHEILAAGADPNSRRETTALDGQELLWSEYTEEECQAIVPDRREWYAIQYVALTPHYDTTIAACQEVIEELISFGVDIYKTFKQPLWPTLPFPFPGEGRDPMLDLDAWNESMIKAGKQSVTDIWTEEPDARKPLPIAGYIARCVIHSLFEDGGIIAPFITNANALDVEYRDPLGRTIIHAACRSCLGADAPITANSTYVGVRKYEHLLLPSSTEPSIFDAVRSLGAELTATDYSGRTILHHLLEARSLSEAAPDIPRIRTTLKYILYNVPELVNKANKHGTTPLHSALQRLSYYKAKQLFSMPERPEDIISDLLDAGADGSATDGRGNTALHYLAECGILEPWLGQKVRALAARLCESYRIDVNIRNAHDRSALEVMFSVDSKLYLLRWSFYPRADSQPDERLRDVDRQVLTMLDQAGANWQAKTSDGKTLMHLAALQLDHHSTETLDFLLDKGVDLKAVDRHDMTVEDEARATRSMRFLEWLEKRQVV